MINRGRQALTPTLPAPVGGLNTLTPLAAMPPQFASVMTNVFPHADRIETRGGYATLATLAAIGKASTVEGWRRLMVHVKGGTETALGAYFWHEDVGGTARSRLRIYTIATDGTLTSSREVVTLASANEVGWVGEWTHFTSGSGTTYVVLLVATENGGAYTFAPQAFDGSAWTIPAITGLPQVVLGVHSHRNRQWFYNCDTISSTAKPLSVYYLPIGAIAGAVTEFNLGPFLSKGGRVVAMRSLTIDGGDGTDDLAAFITDQGQVAVYSGYDPASPSTWRQVGVFDVGRLAAWRSQYHISGDPRIWTPKGAFAIEYKGDVLILAQKGVVSLLKAMRAESDVDDTLSANIRPTLTEAASSIAANENFAAWKIEHMPLIKHLIVSASASFASSSTERVWGADWYVMNTETGAWTKYGSFPMGDSCMVGNKLYMIDGGRGISTFNDTAASDNGSAITFEVRQAYSNFGVPDNKLFTLLLPMLQATGNFSLTVNVDVDYKNRDISTYTSYTVSGTTTLQPTLSPSIYGSAAAVHLKGQTSAGVLSWYATKFAAKPSNSILSTV
jgi:hypothetical protein